VSPTICVCLCVCVCVCACVCVCVCVCACVCVAETIHLLISGLMCVTASSQVIREGCLSDMVICEGSCKIWMLPHTNMETHQWCVVGKWIARYTSPILPGDPAVKVASHTLYHGRCVCFKRNLFTSAVYFMTVRFYSDNYSDNYLLKKKSSFTIKLLATH